MARMLIASTWLVALSTTAVYLRHYRPVFWNTVAEPDPVRNFWRETGTTPWTELLAQDFMVLPGSDPRDLVVTALTEFDFVEGFDYKIEPKPGVLKCDDVDGNPDVFGWLCFLQGE